MGLQPVGRIRRVVLCGHMPKLRIYYQNYTVVYAGRYTTYCYFFYVCPANQPTITGVALCHKKFGGPWSNLSVFFS